MPESLLGGNLSGNRSCIYCATSYLVPLVTLPPVVDVGLQVDRGRLQVGMTELSLEVVEGYAHVEGPDLMEMPQSVRSDDVEGLAASIAPISSLYHLHISRLGQWWRTQPNGIKRLLNPTPSSLLRSLCPESHRMIIVYKYENNYILERLQRHHVYRKCGFQRQDPSGSAKYYGRDEGGELAGGDQEQN